MEPTCGGMHSIAISKASLGLGQLGRSFMAEEEGHLSLVIGELKLAFAFYSL